MGILRLVKIIGVRHLSHNENAFYFFELYVAGMELGIRETISMTVLMERTGFIYFYL